MRIAQVAPLYEAVPPEAYGGTERVIAVLCDGLAAAGHEVTLFGPENSLTDATLQASEQPLRERFSSDELVNLAPHLHLQMLAEIYRRADEFDVIHSHLDIWTLPFTRLRDTPTVLTMHGRLDLDFLRDLLPRYPSVPLVSISDDQRLAVADFDLTWAATVYNGLDLTAYQDVPHDSDGYLGFVGRITEEKGPLAAIEISRRTGVPLRMAAKVDPLDVDYYEDEVKPEMGPDVDFIGEIDEQEKPAFYAGARATLFPSDWPEPFGLVMIESLASGTPVIALRRGSVPEVIDDGVTGFICDDVDEMVKAAERIGEIDPDACRRHAQRFSAEEMCRGYVEVYESLVAGAHQSG
ncbi:glycosyltransferase [Nocardioides sp. MAH-18]|uniref:Glycosyltransferase n=1 Tax=Nocardioides agri TaxID=2682843 RepID=A0A6L6XX47_9ACTN|nr:MULTISPECIES: glycosyltransferase family 4 protein [unclassified Nocardioides]MBA2952486.1 glycosyltransferase family 4 protein [Nocardioides sp. CGMCC 1.13656]MVQ51648.1 glycosyltransferase [Nocardioides sp. MAH-18]